VDSFRTETALVVPAVTTQQMREVDRVAIEEVGPNLYQMMENAGRNLASLCVEMLGDRWTDPPVVVLAGTGGNGGGGICAARHLANRGGDVTLVVSDVARLAGVPAEQLALYRATGGRLADARDLGPLQPALTVDALLGYSLAGAPHGVVCDLIGWMSSGAAPVVALPKTGLHVDAVGQLWVADIGIPRGILERAAVRPPPGLFSRGYRVRLTPHAGPLSRGGPAPL